MYYLHLNFITRNLHDDILMIIVIKKNITGCLPNVLWHVKIIFIPTK